MKHLKTHLSIFALLLLATPLHSQDPDPVCDTLVLNNGRILSVKIDSIVGSTFLYKICASANPNQYRLNVDMVRNQIIHRKVIHRPAPPAAIAFSKMRPLKKWVFKHQSKNITRMLEEKQKIRVQYLAEDWTSLRMAKGNLVYITPNTLRLQSGSDKLLDISMQHIESITYNEGYLNKVLGMIFLSIGTALFTALQVSKPISKFFLSLIMDSSTLVWLSYVPLILALIGIVLLLTPNTQIIDRPFSPEWGIFESTANGQTEVPFTIPDSQRLP